MTILFCLIKGVLKPLPECQTFTVLQWTKNLLKSVVKEKANIFQPPKFLIKKKKPYPRH
jgi:hypothetical protein